MGQFIRYRAWILLGVLILIIPAVYYVTQMESEETFDSWFSADDQVYQFYKAFQKRFANDMFFVVVFKDENLFTSENLTLIASLTDQFEKLPYMRQVTSMTNAEYLYGQGDQLIVEPLVNDADLDENQIDIVRGRALSKPIYRDTLISTDGTTTAILGELEEVVSMTEEMQVVSALESIVKQTEVDSEKTLYLGGYPVLDTKTMQASTQDGIKYVPLTIGVIFLVLWVTFRRSISTALSFAAVVIALIWTLGLYVSLGNAFSMMTSILPVILIAIGIADSVHILIHYYEELSNGLPRFQALRATVQKMFRPCLFTTLTTGVGFISFLSSNIPIVRLTGLYAAIGIVFAFILSVIFLPAMLSFFKAPKQAAQRHDKGWLVTFLDRLMGWTLAHPKQILLGTAVLMILGMTGTYLINTEATILLLLKDDHPLRLDYDFIEQNLTGLSNLEIIVEGEADALRTAGLLGKLDQLSQFAQRQPHVRKTLSVVNYAKEINQALHAGDPEFYSVPETTQALAQSLLLYEFSGGKELRDYVTTDYRAGRLTILFNTISSKQAVELKNTIVNYAETQLDLSIKTTGTIALIEHMMEQVTVSQVRSILIALVLITILMSILLRSVKLGLISLIPNALPILLMFAVMGFANIPLDAVTSIVAGLALSIAVDDTIHYLTRFRRELEQTHDYHKALKRTTRTIGRAIVSTSVILFAGFSVLLLGSFKGTMYFGLLIGLTMAFALIGDLVLLPVILLSFKPIRVSVA